MRLYEGMFVIEGGLAEREWDAVAAELEGIIKRHGGNVVDLRKWDDRRFAYEINRARRGLYVLVHFEAPPLAMQEMRRDFTLSEKILRQLITVDEDGVPVGEDRPGITSSQITEYPEQDDRNDRDERGRRPRRPRPGEEEPVSIEEEGPAKE